MHTCTHTQKESPSLVGLQVAGHGHDVVIGADAHGDLLAARGLEDGLQLTQQALHTACGTQVHLVDHHHHWDAQR